MSLTIRLKKIGSRNRKIYKIVVAEKRSKRNGKSIAEIGYYNPQVDPPVVKVDKSLLEKKIEEGASLSEGVRKILEGKY